MESSVDIGIRLLNILSSGALDADKFEADAERIVGNMRKKLKPAFDAYWEECDARESHIVRGYN